MKKLSKIIAVMATFVLLFVCENNASAQEIKIGTQTWATTNLDVSAFRNGDAIPEANTNAAWEKAGNEQKPAWCYYDNDPTNGKTYGKLYNWYAVNDQRGLSPKGWHIPSEQEWDTLKLYLGGKDVAGTKMKSTSGWKNDENGTNTSGFAGLPGGLREVDGWFSVIGIYGYWWSSTEGNEYYTWARYLYYHGGVVGDDGSFSRRYGFSVRCLAD